MAQELLPRSEPWPETTLLGRSLTGKHTQELNKSGCCSPDLAHRTLRREWESLGLTRSIELCWIFSFAKVPVQRPALGCPSWHSSHCPSPGCVLSNGLQVHPNHWITNGTSYPEAGGKWIPEVLSFWVMDLLLSETPTPSRKSRRDSPAKLFCILCLISSQTDTLYFR